MDKCHASPDNAPRPLSGGLPGSWHVGPGPSGHGRLGLSMPYPSVPRVPGCSGRFGLGTRFCEAPPYRSRVSTGPNAPATGCSGTDAPPADRSWRDLSNGTPYVGPARRTKNFFRTRPFPAASLGQSPWPAAGKAGGNRFSPAHGRPVVRIGSSRVPVDRAHRDPSNGAPYAGHGNGFTLSGLA
jgi:hypothetical protein